MESNDNNTTLQTLKVAVGKFVKDRDWIKYHTARNLAESISIEASELLELFQWSLNEDQASLAAESPKLGRVEEELADVVMYCVGLANATGIDVAKAIFSKLARNEKKYPVQRYKGTYSKPKGD
jgi:NTP pyrophosphatase (non-canonical NTP hydrolase)